MLLVCNWYVTGKQFFWKSFKLKSSFEKMIGKYLSIYQMQLYDLNKMAVFLRGIFAFILGSLCLYAYPTIF